MEKMVMLLFYSLVFMLGASIFSFLNVIVYRVPKKLSFVKGRSFCPDCHHQLGPLDLVPVFSWLFLKGKCRYCGGKIGVRDTLIEIGGGILAVFCCIYYEDIGQILTIFTFFSILTVVTFLDMDTMEIEDGCHLAILAAAVLSWFTMPGSVLADRLIGFVSVSVPMLLLTMLIPGAFGGGDIKLMAVCGLVLGWRQNLMALVFAILTGGTYGAWLLLSRQKGRKEHFAFGPFLCLGILLSVYFGDRLLAWYLSFFL